MLIFVYTSNEWFVLGDANGPSFGKLAGVEVLAQHFAGTD
jgi:hypothetical protein